MYEPDAQTVVTPVLKEFPMLFEDIATHQRSDPDLSAIIDQLSSGEVPGYSLRKGVLHCKARYDGRPKIVAPPFLVPALFGYFHDSPLGGHLGVRKTIHKIRQSLIWKSMDADIAARVRACRVCGISKPAQNTHYGMLASEVANRPMEKMFIDFVGKLPRSTAGNTYALVCVDAFTKFVWIFPVREASTATATRALNSVFAVFGIPEILVSDNASQFTSLNFRRMVFVKGIRHVTTTPYYPQSSHAERFNRNLRAALIAYHHRDHSRWDENLSGLQFAFNSARHDSIRASPFSLVFSFTPNSPLSNLWSIKELLPDEVDTGSIRERWDAARKNLCLAHDSVRRKYDRGRRPPPFQVGSRVWLRNFPVSKAGRHISAKLIPRYRGPYIIAEFTTPVSVKLTDSAGEVRIRAHVSQLKRA
jgi:transposase InsO family protein